MAKNDPAFPVEPFEHYGLTKLEWFAGMALQGLLADGQRIDIDPDCDIAQRAFNMAEAMIVEAERRSK